MLLALLFFRKDICMEERWIEIKGHPDHEISSYGNVRKTYRHRKIPVRRTTDDRGPRVYIDGKQYYVARLMAESFFDIDILGREVKFRDKNKQNTKLHNIYVPMRRGEFM